MAWDDEKFPCENPPCEEANKKITAAEWNAHVIDQKARVPNSLFDAYSILYADVNDTPAALTVAASRLVGRKSTGGIAALTGAEARTILDVSQTSAVVLKTLFDAYTVLYADVDNTPAALTVAASRLVGRKSTGGIAALTAAEAKTILSIAIADISDIPGTIATILSDHDKAAHDSLAIDHGSLSGIADDDHTQYLNTTRHDTTTRHPKSVIAGAPTGDYVGTTDAQELSAKTLSNPKIKDVDATPIGDVLLKVIDEKLKIRNSGDFADVTLEAAFVGDLPASKITSGILDLARIPTPLTGKDADSVDACHAGIATGNVFKIPASIAQGDIFYVDVSGNIVRLGAGTNGHFLKTQGAAANPIWASIPGGGDMLKSTYDPDDDGLIAAAQMESDVMICSGANPMTGNLDMGAGNTILVDHISQKTVGHGVVFDQFVEVTDIEKACDIVADAKNMYLRLTGGNTKAAEIWLYGEDRVLNPGEILFKVPNAAKSVSITAGKIEGVSDAPAWCMDNVKEYTTDHGINIETVNLKDGLVDGKDVSGLQDAIVEDNKTKNITFLTTDAGAGKADTIASFPYNCIIRKIKFRADMTAGQQTAFSCLVNDADGLAPTDTELAWDGKTGTWVNGQYYMNTRTGEVIKCDDATPDTSPTTIARAQKGTTATYWDDNDEIIGLNHGWTLDIFKDTNKKHKEKILSLEMLMTAKGTTDAAITAGDKVINLSADLKNVGKDDWVRITDTTPEEALVQYNTGDVANAANDFQLWVRDALAAHEITKVVEKLCVYDIPVDYRSSGTTLYFTLQCMETNLAANADINIEVEVDKIY